MLLSSTFLVRVGCPHLRVTCAFSSLSLESVRDVSPSPLGDERPYLPCLYDGAATAYGWRAPHPSWYGGYALAFGRRAPPPLNCTENTPSLTGDGRLPTLPGSPRLRAVCVTDFTVAASWISRPRRPRHRRYRAGASAANDDGACRILRASGGLPARAGAAGGVFSTRAFPSLIMLVYKLHICGSRKTLTPPPEEE